MSESHISWSANESEPIEPFKTSSKGLESCALRLNNSERFEQADTRVITGSEFWTDFHPTLKLKPDLDELVNSTGLDLDEIMLSVVIRDRELNKFVKVYSCEAQSFPDVPVDLAPAWSKFSRSTRLDVTIVATPIETANRKLGIASHKAHVVARRTFKLRTMIQSSKIPTRWVSPKEFENLGTSRDTVWLINWLGEDMERTPAEVVEILLNEDFREAFQILDNIGDTFDLFRREMAAAIISELAIRAMGDKDELPVEETGLRRIMFDQLSESSGLSEEQLLVTRERPDFLGRVHAWAQHHVGLNQCFSKL